MPVGVGVGGMAVRGDGSLIIWPLDTDGQPWDDYLHVFSARGGSLSSANRFGPDLSSPSGVRYQGLFDLRSLAVSGGHLWALGTTPGAISSTNDYVQLWELDAASGALVQSFYAAAPKGDQGAVSAQEITADPARGSVVLADYHSDTSSGPETVSSGGSGASNLDLVEIAPDGSRQALFNYAPGGIDYPRSLLVAPGGGGIVAAQEEESDPVVGSSDPDRGAAIGYDRGGNQQWSTLAPWPDQDPPTDTPVAMALGVRGCPPDTLLYSVDDASASPGAAGDLFAVADPEGMALSSSANVEVAAPNPIPGAPANYVTVAAAQPDGSLIFAAWSTVVSIHCLARATVPTPTGRAPSAPPRSASGGPGTGVSGASGASSAPGVAPPAGSGGGGGGASSVQSIQALQPTQVAQASIGHSAQGGAQASASPNVLGVADLAPDEPALSLPATGLSPLNPVDFWFATLGLTAAASGFGLVLSVRTRRQRRRLLEPRVVGISADVQPPRPPSALSS